MTIPRPEYPRPILVREKWLNLNGAWRFCADEKNAGLNARWFDSDLPGNSLITVPYPLESEASGIHDTEPPTIVWYQREVDVPGDWAGRIALRIGASDHWTRVFVNGLEVGQHRGGYAPMAFDIQHALQPGTNRITVRVEDSLSWTQPRGKQAGTTRWPIDYDSVTGIWQTVWLEPLPAVSVESTYPDFSLGSRELAYLVCFSGQVDGELTIELSLDGKTVGAQTVETQLRAEARVTFDLKDVELWSPETPTLYDVKVTLVNRAANDADVVDSYVGLREVRVENGELLLNSKPLYIRGILDQGYFPGGWYTPIDDDAIKRDIELTLAMGLNCARKHQKAEDPRYLYWADKLGLLVWAEMTSGKIFSTELVETLTREWIALVKRDRGHPCVITWVPFNESWGIWHQSERPAQRAFVDGIVGITRALDQSRPVVGNDGWEFSTGDMWTLHLYHSGQDIATRLTELIAEPASSVTGDTRHPRAGALPGAEVALLPILLTECGGVGFGQYSDHDFSYGELPRTEAALEQDIRSITDMITAANVLQGFVWTQLTDVQQEVNGLLYFDRTPKLSLETLRAIFTAIGQPGK